MISLRSGVEPERKSSSFRSPCELSAFPSQGKDSHQRSSEPCACAPVVAIENASTSDTTAKIRAKAPRVTSLLCNAYIVRSGAAHDLLWISRKARILHEHKRLCESAKHTCPQRLWKPLLASEL